MKKLNVNVKFLCFILCVPQLALYVSVCHWLHMLFRKTYLWSSRLCKTPVTKLAYSDKNLFSINNIQSLMTSNQLAEYI